MDPNFHFDDGSSESEIEEKTGTSQSPWEFASYSESVAEEHSRRNTTSVDAKINKALRDCSVSLPDIYEDDEEEEENVDEEEVEDDKEAEVDEGNDDTADDSMNLVF